MVWSFPEALTTMFALKDHDAAYYTMWATWASVVAIAATGIVAVAAIRGGNREKRQDRAIALFRIVQSERHLSLMLRLQPFGSDVDLNRTYHSDSWYKRQTLPYATVNSVTNVRISPLQSSEYAQCMIQVANMYEEMYLHLKHGIVDERLLLDTVSLIVITFFYCVQPLLTDIEDYATIDFNNLRRFARKSQDWLQRHEPHTDQRLLSVDTSERKR